MLLLKQSLTVGCLLALNLAAADESGSLPVPPEVRHFAPLIGHWTTREESLKPDGSGWVPRSAGEWQFVWDYDGFGVRDYYVNPPPDVAVEDERQRARGINLRTFNPKEQRWAMTWLTAAGTPPTFFSATSTPDRIVMLGAEPNAAGYHERITFFDLQADRFSWKKEWSKDQERWFEVHRIFGARKGQEE